MRGASLLSGLTPCLLADRFQEVDTTSVPHTSVSPWATKETPSACRAGMSIDAGMSIERRERAGIGITGIDIGWLLKVPNFVGPRPAFAGFERDRLRRFGGDRKVAHRKAVALGEDFGDAAAVAHTPIGLVAQQTAGPGPGDLGGL